jgi:hypothetical protein
LWIDKGLIGDQSSMMRQLIELNRGNQWEHFGALGSLAGLDSTELATVNKVFPVANTIQGDVASRNPQVQVIPRVPQYSTGARPVENLVNYDIDELNMKKQANRALMHHLWAPAGFMRNGFTPQEEFETDTDKPRRMQMYRPAKPDRPWVKAVPIWNILIDPMHESFHPDDGAWWCAFRDIMELEDIRSNPNMISREDLGDFAGNIDADWAMMRTEEFKRNEDPDRENHVEVWTVYEAKERTWFQITLDGLDKPLRNPDDWPIPWETLPYSVFSVNEQMDTPFDQAIMDQVGPIQVELNRLRTMIGQLVYRLPRVIGYNQGALNPDELAKLQYAGVKELIGFKGPVKDNLEVVNTGDVPQGLLALNALLTEDLRESIGQSKMDRAQRENVESASEAAFIQQGSDVNTGRISDAFEDFWKDFIRLHMQGRRATMDITGEETIRIVGQQDADGLQVWESVSPKILHGDYEFHVVPGSTRKLDRNAEVQKAAADFQLAAAAPNFFNTAYYARKYVEARNQPLDQALSETALVASKVQALGKTQQDARAAAGDPAQGGGGGAPQTGIPPAVAQALAGQNGGGGGLPQ